MTFIGNEGVVVDSGQSAIAIDAMFGDGAGPYADTPPALRDALEAARGAWRNIDLILATHGHPDHFEARAVVRHMRSNPDAHLVTTPQAVAMLSAEPGA